MGCRCRHDEGGECRRFPPQPVIEMGRTAWRFPPAQSECGERSPVRASKPKGEAKPAKEGNKAADGARGAAESKTKRAKGGEK